MLGFREKVLIEKAARDAGFEILFEENNGQATFRSSLVPGALSIRPSEGGYLLSVSNAAIQNELTASYVPGNTGYSLQGEAIRVHTTLALQEIAERIFHLSMSLPNRPLDLFRQQTDRPIGETEIRRLVLQRVGQDIFRDALDHYWGGRCPITGISDRALLRASHIKRWADCEKDEERLDVFNGILLAAHLDAAFDAALMTFDAEGGPVMSKKLSHPARAALEAAFNGQRLPLSASHHAYLAHHRIRFDQLQG